MSEQQLAQACWPYVAFHRAAVDDPHPVRPIFVPVAPAAAIVMPAWRLLT